MAGFGKDLLFAARMVRRNKGLASMAILAMALGIGANSAIFSVVSAVLLRPLPYPDPDRVVVLRESRPKANIEYTYIAFVEYEEWKRQTRTFSHLAAYYFDFINFTGGDGGEPQRLLGLRVAPDFFELLGVQPAAGRGFAAGEDTPGRDRVAVLGYGFWQRVYGGDAGVVGGAILLNGLSYQIVGILPRGYEFTSVEFDVYVPLSFQDPTRRQGHMLEVMGRLAPGTSLEQARAEMKLIASSVETAMPALSAGHGVYLATQYDEMVREVRPKLLVLLGAVGFVLLIACANVANLLLARATTRTREIAVRAALGAGRWRIVRQLLTESVLLSSIGGLLGLALASASLRVLVGFAPAETPRANLIGLDAGVAGFALLLSVATGILFGLAPALRLAGGGLNAPLRDGARGTTGGAAQRRLRSLLVISEVALSLMLLIGAALMIETFLRLRNVNPGFRPERLLTLQMALASADIAKPADWVNFYRQVLDRVRALPGVQTVGTTTHLPFGGTFANIAYTIEGRAPERLDERPAAISRGVSPRYFEAMGIPVLEGREFTDADAEDAPKVAVINQRLARRYWPNESPIGKRLRRGQTEMGFTIVGVVGDIRHMQLRAEPREEIYNCYPQLPARAIILVIRTRQEPLDLAQAVRAEIRLINPNQAVHTVRTMEQLLAQSMASERVLTFLLGAFAVLAAVMASLGVYGVISHSVSVRRHEIGVRMALGAQTGDVIGEILRHAAALTAGGILAGLVGAYAIRNVMTNLIWGVAATDPLIFAGVSLLLAGVAMAASYLPARRATLIDPLVALRHE